jgi:ABC-type amino acid transport substrate-binding protein
MNHCPQLVVALLLCAMPCFAAEGRNEDRLLLGVLKNPPFAIEEKDKAPSGLYVELLATIMEHAKIDATVEIFPLARVIAQLKHGSIAATLAIPNSDILDISVPVAVVAQLDSIAVGLRGTHIDAFEDLYGKNVCVLRGASFAPRLHEDSRIKKTEVSEPGACIRMMRAGRVDFVATPRVGVWWHARTGTIDQGELGEPFILNRRPVYLLLSKKAATPALMKSLAEGVRLARADGSIDVIVKRYGQ